MGRPLHPDYKDVPRVCYACGGTKTYKDWFLNHGTKFVLCQGCYSKYIRIPTYRPQVRGHTIRFFEKRILYRWLVRTGYCVACPNNVHDGTCKLTTFHHQYYLRICPWFGLQELCSKCHIETWLDEGVKHWSKKRQALGLKETWGARKWREKKMYPLVPM